VKSETHHRHRRVHAYSQQPHAQRAAGLRSPAICLRTAHAVLVASVSIRQFKYRGFYGWQHKKLHIALAESTPVFEMNHTRQELNAGFQPR
jgi:hypothetical protein